MESLIVQKFGGTCMGSPERIRSVAKRVARVRASGKRIVVVVSAMGKTTDDLLSLASEVTEGRIHQGLELHREVDMLLTAGERISMALLSMALQELGVPAVSLTGSQCGILTDGSHRRARIRTILGDRARLALAENRVVIVAGFQGMSYPEREITTLGRGGSDTTAVALAATLGAEFCDIYTDVDGVYSADPREVPGAQFRPRVDSDQMLELAANGAGVLHSRSVALARKHGVRLRVLNGIGDQEVESTKSTVIENQAAGLEAIRVTGVTADEELLGLEVELARPSALAALWAPIRAAQWRVVAPQFELERVRLFVARDEWSEWEVALHDLIKEGFLKSFRGRLDLVPVTVVGSCFSQDAGLLSEIVEGLAEERIIVTMGGSTSVGVTLGVALENSKDAVRLIHSRWVEAR